MEGSGLWAEPSKKKSLVNFWSSIYIFYHSFFPHSLSFWMVLTFWKLEYYLFGNRNLDKGLWTITRCAFCFSQDKIMWVQGFTDLSKICWFMYLFIMWKFYSNIVTYYPQSFRKYIWGKMTSGLGSFCSQLHLVSFIYCFWLSKPHIYPYHPQ